MNPLRPALAAASALALAAGLSLAATPASAAVTPCWDEVFTDFDGGGPDVVVGLPSYDLPGKVDAGAIAVFSNVAARGETDPKAPTASTILTADDFDGLTSQAGARFGAAVAAWQDLGTSDDADFCADLLVGAPGQTVIGQVGAGQVYRLGGSDSGFGSVLSTFDESTLVGADGPEEGAGFGSSIAANTWSTLVIGAPGRDVDEISDAGRVVRLNWFAIDGEPEVVVIEQREFDLEDENAEPGDRFGEVLDLLATGDGDVLVVGVPHEDVGATVDAGAIELFSATTDSVSMMTQNRRGAGGQAETGDLYGSTIDHWWTFTDQPVARIAIGVPGEDVGSAQDAGMVSFATFDLGQTPEDGMSALKGIKETVTQDTPGVPGAVEAGDRYGTSLLTGEFGQDSGRVNLVVGAPYEDLGSVKDAGQASMTRFETDASPTTGIYPAAWTQDSTGTSGAPEKGDRFGAAMSSVLLTNIEDDDDVVWEVTLVTVPREDSGGVVDAGLAYLGYAPGAVAVPLSMPVKQTGAGIGMVPDDRLPRRLRSRAFSGG